MISFNALTAVGALRAPIDFTLSNARRFYSSMGNPLAVKELSRKSAFFIFQCGENSHLTVRLKEKLGVDFHFGSPSCLGYHPISSAVARGGAQGSRAPPVFFPKKTDLYKMLKIKYF